MPLCYCTSAFFSSGLQWNHWLKCCVKFFYCTLFWLIESTELDKTDNCCEVFLACYFFLSCICKIALAIPHWLWQPCTDVFIWTITLFSWSYRNTSMLLPLFSYAHILQTKCIQKKHIPGILHPNNPKPIREAIEGLICQEAGEGAVAALPVAENAPPVWAICREPGREGGTVRVWVSGASNGC